MITIGQMNKRIIFRLETKTADTSAGTLTDYPDDSFEVWAAVKKISGQRAFDSGFDGLIDNYDVWVRYGSDMDVVTKDTRITWNGKDFGIKNPERIDHNGETQTNGSIYHFVMTEVS